MSDAYEMSDMSGRKAPEADEAGVNPAPQSELRWYYKPMTLGCFTLPAYGSPAFQLFMVAAICFLLPGMYNAMTGVGGGGQVDPHWFDDAQTALYSCFSIAAFFSGSVVNRIGVRYTLVAGGLGYTLFASALLNYNLHHNHVFVVVSGGFLGISAGLLWAAQGTIMVSYPPERWKGRFISAFWCLFNSGAVIGSFVSHPTVPDGRMRH